MKRLGSYFSIFIFQFSLIFSACAQKPQVVDYSVDSVRFVEAEWSVDSLDGYVLKRYHFDNGQLFCSAQNICLIEIPRGSERRLGFAYDTIPAEVSTFAERAGAMAAVNGSYFDINLGNPICFLRVDGVNIGENIPNLGDSVNRKYYQHAALALRDGRPRIVQPDSNRFWEDSLDYADIMTAGPMLIRHGELVPQRDDRTFVTHRHNRTALGLRPDGTVLIVSADGRFKKQAEGLTLPELELVMKWLGCREAINLDGGGSTTMYVREAGGVVNYPSDNRRYDHEGQRPVANAIVVF